MKIKDYLLSGKYKLISLKKDEVIYHEGDICSSVCFIKDGTIKGTRSFSDGHESIIRILTKNKIIGLSLIFSSDPKYSATFTAVSDSTVYIMTKDELIQILQNDREFALEFLSLMSNNTIELNHHIRLLSYKTIRERLSFLFYSEYLKNKNLTFRITETKIDLANLLNVERSSLSYEMHKMIDEGIIANKGHYYTILDIKKIEEVI